MRLTIRHHTEYRYDQPVTYALQRLRLWPRERPSQSILEWDLEVEGATKEARFTDGFGNITWLVCARDGTDHIGVSARGVVETSDVGGVFGPSKVFAPPWLFLQPTPLSAPGKAVRNLAARIDGADALERMHHLMKLVAAEVAYEVGATHPATGAEEALSGGTGVCQDHAHVFCAAARLDGIPARYASGYLFMHGNDDQAASHAWAEAHIDGLGWVGFDCANAISPDERYVRLATGRDYTDCAPVSGIRFGAAQESLAVRINVSQ